MNIGKAIRELRKEKGLSQGDLALKAKITQAALSAIEIKGVRPNPETLKNICLALTIPESLIYVMGMERNDVPQTKQTVYDELFPLIQEMVLRVSEV
jgi:transcriptional regulator with XRE-family HTH domain